MNEPHYGVAMGCSVLPDRSGVEWNSSILLPDRGTELVIFGLENKTFGLCNNIENATGECIDPYGDTFFSPEKAKVIINILNNALEELSGFPDQWQEVSYGPMPTGENHYCVVSKDIVIHTLVSIRSLLENSISKNCFFALIGN